MNDTHISIESSRTLCKSEGESVSPNEATCIKCKELYAWLKRSFEGH